MTGDRFDEFLTEAVRDYNAPPADVPREEMWARIDQARRFRRPAERRTRPGWVRWGVGIAAVLAIGIGIGRTSFAPESPRVAERAGADAQPQADLPYRLAALQHLTQAEALLTTYKAGEGSGAEVQKWAADLLTTTRLMLDSPAAEDAKTQQLLRDLELVLAQIAQLPAARQKSEKVFIDEAIEEKDVLPRLRAAVPSGPVRTTI